MIFNGEYKALSQAPWISHLKNWLSTLSQEDRLVWVQFFEEKILIEGLNTEYTESEMCKLLHDNLHLT